MKTFKRVTLIISVMLFCALFARAQRPPGLRSQLKQFYKVNKTYTFIVPGTSTKSQKISIYWDTAQVAHYTIGLIKRDSAKEKSHIVFVPESFIDAERGSIKVQPATIKITTLIWHDNGTPTPLEWLNCPCYCWVCGSTPALYNYTDHWYYCPSFPDQPQLVLCGNGGSIGPDLLTFAQWE